MKKVYYLTTDVYLSYSVEVLLEFVKEEKGILEFKLKKYYKPNKFRYITLKAERRNIILNNEKYKRIEVFDAGYGAKEYKGNYIEEIIIPNNIKPEKVIYE